MTNPRFLLVRAILSLAAGLLLADSWISGELGDWVVIYWIAFFIAAWLIGTGIVSLLFFIAWYENPQPITVRDVQQNADGTFGRKP